MSSRPAVEHDFFPMESESANFPKPPTEKLFGRRRSFRDIQGVISKMNPEVVKAVINAQPMENGSISTPKASYQVPSTPMENQNFFAPLPIYTPTSRPPSAYENGAETAPLTIFYNGTVSVFDVPQHKADDIIKLAEEVSSVTMGSDEDTKLGILFNPTFNGNLPLERKQSLMRFLEKRNKERLAMGYFVGALYGCPMGALASQNAWEPTDKVGTSGFN